MLNSPIFLYLILNFMFTNHRTSRIPGTLSVPSYWRRPAACRVGILLRWLTQGGPLL